MKKRFDFIELPIKGLYKINRRPIGDKRGFLARFFCAEEFMKFGFNRPVAQINQTLTRIKGTIRGMHFQHPPYAETKLVTCIQGKIFDVAIDIRKNSPTFLEWHGEILSAENMASLLIPDGFAHGFQTLTDNCMMLYLHTASYHPEAEGALNALDTEFAINWPLEVTEMSDRDRNHPFVNASFKGVEL
jgi:dTDP-4-dehydrorhamnose 3,5-epimerase